MHMQTNGCLCLIVSNNFPPSIGGAGAVYAALAQAAQGRVHVLCASHDYRDGAVLPGFAAYDAQCAFPITRISAIRPRLRRADRLRELTIRLRLLLRIWRLHRVHRFPTLLIADDESVGWLIATAQRLLGCRVILYTHGDDLARRTGREKLDARRASQFRRADAVIAVSNAAADDLVRGFGTPRASITVIPNGIDLVHFVPLPVEPALRDRYGLGDRRVVCTIARLVPRKGVDRVLEAIMLLLPEFPDLHYLVIGDGPEAPALHARAHAIRDHVTFAGAIPASEIPRHIALAEIMIMANRRMPDGEDEGFGLVFLEANACGKPVIAGNAGGAPEVIRDGVNGLLVDGADPTAIAAALRRLLNDDALARGLAANGLAMAREASWTQRAQSFLDLCARLARQ